MSSKSSASTSSQTQANTTTSYQTLDQRQGVDGQGNLAVGSNATVSITDTSSDIAKAALDAAQGTSQAALDANTKASQQAAQVASDALSANVQSQARSLDSVNNAVNKTADVAGTALTNSERAVEAVSKTFSDLSSGQVNLLSDIVKSNADLTAQNQQNTDQLANSFLEKSVTAIADSRQATDQQILTSAFQYGTYAVVAVAIAFGLYSLRKAK